MGLLRIAFGFVTLSVLLSGCAHRRAAYPPAPKPDQCHGRGSVALEPEEDSRPVVARVENESRDAYDRDYYLTQAKADMTLVTTRDSVPLKGVQSASILINMKRGSLTVRGGGTPNLLDAEFQYTTVEPIPIVGYQTQGTHRTVDILGMGKDNAWTLNLSDRIPVALHLESAGGTREFNLEDIPVTELHLKSLGGSSVLNLPGDHSYLSSFHVHQSQGSISLSAPGSYENWLRGELMTCRGDFSASFTGFYSKLSHLKLGSRHGDVDLDLTGCWQKICRIKVTATCGNLRIKLPAGLGCSVRIHHSCASICAMGMHKTWSSDAWVNPAYGKTEVFLDIEVAATCGKIDLILDACCCPPWVW